MKVLSFVAITMVAFLHIGSAALVDDFNDFKALFPTKKITALVTKYLMNDKEFEDIYLYMQTSEDVQEVAFEVNKMPEIQELVAWVAQHYEDQTNYYRSRRSIKRGLGGFQAFKDELMALLPIDQMIELGRKKIAEGGVFAEFYAKLQALKPVYERIEKLPAYIRYTTHLKELGVDIEEFNKLSKKLLGWE